MKSLKYNIGNYTLSIAIQGGKSLKNIKKLKKIRLNFS